MTKKSFLKSSLPSRKKFAYVQALKKLQPRQFFYMGVVLVVLVYLKPILTVWSYSDESDYFSDSTTIGRQFAEDGNLFGSFIYNHVSLLIANSTADLWRLRFLSLVCLLLIINNFSKQVLLLNQSRSIQFLIPLALMLPAPMTYISFAMIWQGSLGMLLAYFSSIIWLKNLGPIRIVPIIFLCLSITMSPVNAFSIFGFYAALFILTRAHTSSFSKTLKSLFALYGISGTLSVVTLFVAENVFNLEYSARVGLVSLGNIPEKMYWIFSRPIAVSVRFFDISSPTIMNALAQVFLVSIILFFGFFLQSRVLNEKVYKRIFLFLILVLSSITPILITWSNQIEFRYILGPSFAIFLVFSMMLLELANLKKNISLYLNPILTVSIAIIGIATVSINTDSQFVGPYKAKNIFITSEILKCLDRDPVITLVVIQPPEMGFPSRKNIGIFSQVTDLDSPWVPAPSVKNVLNTLGTGFSEVVVANNTDSREFEDACVVDLESYRQILLNANQ